MKALLYRRKSSVSMNSTSRILTGCSRKPSVVYFTPCSFAGSLKTLPKSKKLSREWNLLGRRISLQQTYSGRMDGHAVGILARLELWNASHPTGGHSLLLCQRFAVFCTAWCSCCCGWHSRSSVADIDWYECSLVVTSTRTPRPSVNSRHFRRHHAVNGFATRFALKYRGSPVTS